MKPLIKSKRTFLFFSLLLLLLLAAFIIINHSGSHIPEKLAIKEQIKPVENVVVKEPVMPVEDGPEVVEVKRDEHISSPQSPAPVIPPEFNETLSATTDTEIGTSVLPGENEEANDDDYEKPKKLELDIVANQVMMSFTDSFKAYSREEKDKLLEPYGVKILKEFPYAGNSTLLEIKGVRPSLAGQLPKGETKESVYERVNDVIKKLEGLSFVRYASPDTIVQANSVPNDPRYNELSGLKKIEAKQAWEYIEQNNLNPSEIIVGVIDSGVDYTHPDLAANMWVNPGEIAGDGIDNDGNGYIDDIHGWDAVNDDGDPMDDNYHGTHVAGTIGAVRGNNEGIVGVTPYIKLMALKFLDENGYGSSSGAIELLNYIHLMKQEYNVDIRLTNNSWGGGLYYEPLKDAISYSNDLGILFIAAAGNDGRNTDSLLYYPQGYDLENIISVAATDRLDRVASFSNYGMVTVDIAAPGVSILSTDLNHGYRYASGTSMAAPHVSGTVALLLSSDTGLTALQAKERVLAASNILTTSLSDKVANAAMLNARRTLLPALMEFDSTDNILTIDEGNSLSFQVRLKQAVSTVVTATMMNIDGNGEVILNSPSLIDFTPDNWNQWQTITFSAPQDPGIRDNLVVFQLEIPDTLPVRLYITNKDDDAALATDLCTANTDISTGECNALVALYSSTNGDSWTDLSNNYWLETYAPCEWNGVTCVNSQVVKLDLERGGLDGALPPEIGGLVNLTELNLQLNFSLTGDMPSTIGNLQQLRILNLSATGIDSIAPQLSDLDQLEILHLRNGHIEDIPPELGSLANLKELAISGPMTVPPELGNLSNLESLYLYSGSGAVAGPTQIPSELGNLTKLKYLEIAGSNFIGELPSTLGNLIQLEKLVLNLSEVTGSIPSTIGSLTNLQSMSVLGRSIGGIIPTQLGNLINLKELFLTLNTSDSSIPAEIGNLTNLEALSISGHGLSGEIPSTIGNLVNLKILRIHNTQIGGGIPATIGNLVNLEQLDLDKNQLTGLPTEWGNLVALQRLSIKDNQLVGTIPSMDNLNQLVDLNLSKNQLVGTIPSMENLNQLVGLNLSNNQLVGTISSIGNLNQLNSLNLSYNQFTGVIPQEIYSLINLRGLDLSGNQLIGNLSPDIGNLTELNSLLLSHNHIEGVIPSSIGSFRQMSDLFLGGNRFSGSIPPEIGNLDSLFDMSLAGNQLSGAVPSTMTQLRFPSFIYLNSNALEVTDEAVLEHFGSSIKNTQTVPPTDVIVTVSNEELVLSWTPIPYSNGAGEYIISYADSADGPYIEHGRTDSKASSEYIVEDFTTYPGRYYVIQTHTPSNSGGDPYIEPDLDPDLVSFGYLAFQQNDIVSRYSDAVRPNLPPVITLPAPITVEAPTWAGITIDNSSVNSFLTGATAIDPLGGDVTHLMTHNAPALFPLGETEITFSICTTDNRCSSASQIVTVLPTGNWTNCASEFGTCIPPVTAMVRYGAEGQYFYQQVSGAITCNNATFGNPINVRKQCDYLLSDITDFDGDGVVDSLDAFPADANESADTDGDGQGDNVDPVPNDPNDGGIWFHCANEYQHCIVPMSTRVRYGNANQYQYQQVESSIACASSRFDSLDSSVKNRQCFYWLSNAADSDNDGVLDSQDDFPNAPTEVHDSDNDGVGDNSDPFPNDGDNDINGSWVYCAIEFDTCIVPVPSIVRYGLSGQYVYKHIEGSVECKNHVFGNPINVRKQCEYFLSNIHDYDGDGVVDSADAFPTDASESADTDGDGIGDNADTSSNGSGVWFDCASQYQYCFVPFPTQVRYGSDNQYQYQQVESFIACAPSRFDPLDDSVSNRRCAYWLSDIEDFDNDGVVDSQDALPNNATEISDSDGDGVGDNSDPFPNDPDNNINGNWSYCSNELDTCHVPVPTIVRYGLEGQYFYQYVEGSVECKNHVFGNPISVRKQCDYFLSDTNDYDGDGVVDSEDLFPTDASESTDTDGDGIGDNADIFPNDANNGIGDEGWTWCSNEFGRCTTPIPSVIRFGINQSYTYLNVDAGVELACRTSVFGEPLPGSLKHCDYYLSDQNDYDGDGVMDRADAFPADASESIDSDGDGIGDNSDPFVSDPSNRAITNNNPWVVCASEFASCQVPSIATVRYGANDQFVMMEGVTGSIQCTNGTFGNDPVPNTPKACEYRLESQSFNETLGSTSEDSQYNAGNPQRIRSELVGSPSYMTLSPVRKTLDNTDVVIDYMVHEPVASPKGVFVLIAGGQLDAELMVDIDSNITSAGDDFLVRSAHLFAEHGYKVVTINHPSDKAGDMNLGTDDYLYDSYRYSMRHAVDVSTIINTENLNDLPVFILGTDRGAISAMALNSMVDAIDISSTVTTGVGMPVQSSHFDFVNLIDNVHISQHLNDSCLLSLTAEAQNLYDELVVNGSRVQINGFYGGFNNPAQPDACQSDTLHGFFGIESGAVDRTTQWFDSLLVRFLGVRPVAAPVTLIAGTTTIDLSVLSDGEGELFYSLPFTESSLGGTLLLNNGVVTYTPPANTVSTEDSFVYVVKSSNGRVSHNVVKILLQ